MKISIIIVNFNGMHVTKNCIESIYRSHGMDDVEVIVVDNCSTDDSRSVLPSTFPEIVFHEMTANRGFGAANNAGAKIASGEILFFLNNDTLITTEIIDTLARFLMKDESIGIVAPRLMNGDGTFQVSFGKYPTIANEMVSRRISKDPALQARENTDSALPVKKEWVTAAALMIRKSLFDSAGGFDENYFMYFEDADLCRRVNDLGRSVWYLPEPWLIHLGGKSYNKGDQWIEYEYRKSQMLFYSKHNTIIQRCILRMFLLMKYIPLLFIGYRRAAAQRVLSLSLGFR